MSFGTTMDIKRQIKEIIDNADKYHVVITVEDDNGFLISDTYFKNISTKDVITNLLSTKE